jgi:hypothetical protein
MAGLTAPPTASFGARWPGRVARPDDVRMPVAEPSPELEDRLRDRVEASASERRCSGLRMRSAAVVRESLACPARSTPAPTTAGSSLRRRYGSGSSVSACRRSSSNWGDGYVESFNGKLRDECLDIERFDTLLEAQVLIERWRLDYNHLRPHSALGYRPPAPEAIEPRLDRARDWTNSSVAQRCPLLPSAHDVRSAVRTAHGGSSSQPDEPTPSMRTLIPDAAGRSSSTRQARPIPDIVATFGSARQAAARIGTDPPNASGRRAPTPSPRRTEHS